MLRKGGKGASKGTVAGTRLGWVADAPWRRRPGPGQPASPSSGRFDTSIPFDRRSHGVRRGRDTIGDSAVVGDVRWAGAFGVNVDLVARSHCSVEIIKLEDIQAGRREGGGRNRGKGGETQADRER